MFGAVSFPFLCWRRRKKIENTVFVVSSMFIAPEHISNGWPSTSGKLFNHCFEWFMMYSSSRMFANFTETNKKSCHWQWNAVYTFTFLLLNVKLRKTNTIGVKSIKTNISSLYLSNLAKKNRTKSYCVFVCGSRPSQTHFKPLRYYANRPNHDAPAAKHKHTINCCVWIACSVCLLVGTIEDKKVQ